MHAVFRKDVAKIGRSHKARDEVLVVLLEARAEAGFDVFAERFGHEIEAEGKDEGGLRFGNEAAALRHKFLLEGSDDLLMQGFICCGVLHFAEDAGCLCDELRRISVVGGGDEIVVGRALVVFGVVPVKREPIAVLEPIEPKIVLGVQADVLHPMLHALVLAGKKAGIAVDFVDSPRADGGCIPPGGRAEVVDGDDVGDRLRNALFDGLFGGDVAQPFCKEGRDVIVERRRAAEDLRIPRPAEALVALRAVGGKIEEVAPLPPDDVLLQAVYKGVFAGEGARLLHIGVQHEEGEIFGADLVDALDAEIAEAVEGEVRAERLFAACQDVGILRFGAAEVGGVEIALFIEHFGMRERDLLPARAVHRKLHDARGVLAEVDDLLPLGRYDELFARDAFGDADGLVDLREEIFLRIGDDLDGEALFGFERRVEEFAVLEFGEAESALLCRPLFVGRESLLGAVFQRESEL